MTTTPSAATWRRVVKQAHDGDPRHLLELLLQPHTVDAHGNPKLGANGERPFYDLPDDGELRLAIVRVMMLGPWRKATSIGELMTRTGWGKSKPRLAAIEVDFAAIGESLGLNADDMADALNVDAGTLRKKVTARRKKPA